MDRLLIYLGRLFVILAGFAVAAIVASAAIHLLMLPQLGLAPGEATSVLAAAMTFSVPFVALFVAYFAFIPACIAIALAEGWSVRTWLYHALAGGTVGLILAILFRTSATDNFLAAGSKIEVIPGGGDSVYDPRLLAVMIASGMLGGLAYWLVAGRTSGSWRRVRG